MAKIGGPVAKLAEGQPTLDRGILTIALRGGRVLADGRRALRNPALADAVARCYPDRTQVDVIPLAGTGTKKDVQDALERKVLADPDMKRILEALDATLTRVIPLTDGD